MFKLSFIFCVIFTTLFANEPNQETIQSIQEFYTQSLGEPEALVFTPPEGWLAADPKLLTKHVKAIVIGKGQNNFPPSINLGIEPYPGTVKEYLKMIKSINDAQGATWKDLGLIKTQAGNASLSQVDMPSEWGEIRLMHVILIRNETLYILTAAALKEEFPLYYKDFFNSMSSLKFNKDVFEMVTSAKKRSDLYKAVKELKAHFNDSLSKQEREGLFKSDSFQSQQWGNFQKWVDDNYNEMGSSWKQFLLRKIEKDLLGNAD